MIIILCEFIILIKIILPNKCFFIFLNFFLFIFLFWYFLLWYVREDMNGDMREACEYKDKLTEGSRLKWCPHPKKRKGNFWVPLSSVLNREGNKAEIPPLSWIRWLLFQPKKDAKDEGTVVVPHRDRTWEWEWRIKDPYYSYFPPGPTGITRWREQ